MTKYRRRYLDDREKHRRWIDPRLSTVRVPQLCAYLRSKGWEEVPTDRPGFLVYQEPGSTGAEPLCQFVPEADDWDGFAAQVYDLIAGVAEVEDRYAGDVLTDVLRQPANGEGNEAQRPQEQKVGATK